MEKMYYFVGDTHNGRIYKRFTSYDKAMAYIRGEYAYDKEHENDGKTTFIDGYYGIYRISEDEAEIYGWDYVRTDVNTMEFMGVVRYDDAMKYVPSDDTDDADEDDGYYDYE